VPVPVPVQVPVQVQVQVQAQVWTLARTSSPQMWETR
jgi:hypothetical protein